MFLEKALYNDFSACDKNTLSVVGLFNGNFKEVLKYKVVLRFVGPTDLPITNVRTHHACIA